MGMVKKLHGRAVAYDVVDGLIQEVYKSEVLDATEHDVLGSPTITQLDYEPYGDLHALIEFGVRPKFELAEISGTRVSRLVHDVTGEEVEQELERVRASRAQFEEIDGSAGDDDFVKVDLQELDEETGTPVIGSRQEGVLFHLGSKELDQNVKDALKGSGAGDTVRFTITHDQPHDHDHDHDHEHEHSHGHSHQHRYQATVKEVQKRVLPELNDELASTVSEGQIESIEALRDDIEKRLKEQWDRALRDKLEDDMVRAVVEMHDFQIPKSVTEMYLDSQVEEIARRNNGQLPEGFDVEYFRAQNREEAERMGRWMLIRDKIIAENEIEVESGDLDKAFGEMGGGEASADSVRAFVEQSYPDVFDRMQRRIQSEKVFDWLVDKFEVEEKEWTDDRDE
jgi:trigger factor